LKLLVIGINGKLGERCSKTAEDKHRAEPLNGSCRKERLEGGRQRVGKA